MKKSFASLELAVLIKYPGSDSSVAVLLKALFLESLCLPVHILLEHE